MSVWPESVSLSTPEGTLVSVSIVVPAQRLESLLDALAQVDFPVNPQIYHGEIGGGDTVVEFPAFENHLSEVARALEAYGFSRGSMTVTNMLQAIAAAHHP